MSGPFVDIDMMGWREMCRDLHGTVVPEVKQVKLPIVAAATAQDTLLVIPAGSIILPNVGIRVVTLEATGGTKTIDLGISGGDENGFIDGLSCAAAGTILATLADGAQTLGVLLSTDESGGDLVPEGYVCAADVTIAYTLGSDDFEELEAFAFLEVIEFE